MCSQELTPWVPKVGVDWAISFLLAVLGCLWEKCSEVSPFPWYSENLVLMCYQALKGKTFAAHYTVVPSPVTRATSPTNGQGTCHPMHCTQDRGNKNVSFYMIYQEPNNTAISVL